MPATAWPAPSRDDTHPKFSGHTGNGEGMPAPRPKPRRLGAEPARVFRADKAVVEENYFGQRNATRRRSLDQQIGYQQEFRQHLHRLMLAPPPFQQGTKRTC